MKFKEYLNENAPHFDSEEWIIGGKRRNRYAASGNYHDALKKHDPIGYQVAKQEFEREHKQFKTKAMNKAVKKLKEEWDNIDKIKIFEIEVLDKRTNEMDYIVFDISFEKHSLIAQHVALNKKQENSKKIAFQKITVNTDFSLDQNLVELFDQCNNAIIEGEFYKLNK